MNIEYKSMNIEYESITSGVVVIYDNDNENIYVVGLLTNKIERQATWISGLTNDDVECMIRKVLENSSFDVEEEIEQYQKSEMYQLLKEEEEE
jgi:hypothetical protein